MSDDANQTLDNKSIISEAESHDTRISHLSRYPELCYQLQEMFKEKGNTPRGLCIGIGGMEELVMYVSASRAVRPLETPNLTACDIVSAADYVDKLENNGIEFDNKKDNELDWENVEGRDLRFIRTFFSDEESVLKPNPILQQDLLNVMRNNYVNANLAGLINHSTSDIGLNGSFDYISCQNVLMYIKPQIFINRDQRDLEMKSAIIGNLLGALNPGGLIALYHDSDRGKILAAVDAAHRTQNIQLKVVDLDNMIFRRCEVGEEGDNLRFLDTYKDQITTNQSNVRKTGNIFGM